MCAHFLTLTVDHQGKWKLVTPENPTDRVQNHKSIRWLTAEPLSSYAWCFALKVSLAFLYILINGFNNPILLNYFKTHNYLKFSNVWTLTMKMEQTECSETSVHKIQKPGNHPKERIQYSEQGESFKWRTMTLLEALFTKGSEVALRAQKDCMERFIVTVGNYCERGKVNKKSFLINKTHFESRLHT